MSENALLGDGSTYNKKNPYIENGMTVQRCLAVFVCIQVLLFDEMFIKALGIYSLG